MRRAFFTFLCWFLPIKRIRSKLKAKYIKAHPIRYSSGNCVILHTVSGKIIKNPYSVCGLNIIFRGTNNKIELFEPINFVSCEFIVGNDCDIIIHKSHHICMRIYAWNKSRVFLDDDAELGNVTVRMMNESETSLHIGKRVVFSYDIEIYTTDTHPVLDLNKNIINNKKSCVIVGDHVWVGASAVLLKGAQIAKNSIVGHSSVVSNKFTEENVVIAGNPAKIVKRNVNWRSGIISK